MQYPSGPYRALLSTRWRSITVSDQEHAVLRLSANGLTSFQIAGHLGVSESTIEEYWKRVRRKLKARNKVHAVAIALQLRLIQ